MIRGFFYLTLFFVTVALGIVYVKSQLNPIDKKSWVLNIPIAHRGLFNNDKGIPENSLMAFQRAVDEGYAIELDVHLSNDGFVVVYHDENIRRLTGVNANVSDLALKDLQSKMLLETNEKIPSLKEVLDLIAGQVPIFVEIKKSNIHQSLKRQQQENAPQESDLESAVLEALEGYQGEHALISFSSKSMALIDTLKPEKTRGQNIYPPQNYQGQSGVINFFAQLFKFVPIIVRSNPEFIVYDHKIVHDKVARLLRNFLPLISYNVNSGDDFEHATHNAQNVIFENIRPKI